MKVLIEVGFYLDRENSVTFSQGGCIYSRFFDTDDQLRKIIKDWAISASVIRIECKVYIPHAGFKEMGDDLDEFEWETFGIAETVFERIDCFRKCCFEEAIPKIYNKLKGM